MRNCSPIEARSLLGRAQRAGRIFVGRFDPAVLQFGEFRLEREFVVVAQDRRLAHLERVQVRADAVAFAPPRREGVHSGFACRAFTANVGEQHCRKAVEARAGCVGGEPRRLHAIRALLERALAVQQFGQPSAAGSQVLELFDAQRIEDGAHGIGGRAFGAERVVRDALFFAHALLAPRALAVLDETQRTDRPRRRPPRRRSTSSYERWQSRSRRTARSGRRPA